jgi:hypothetical protein
MFCTFGDELPGWRRASVTEPAALARLSEIERGGPESLTAIVEQIVNSLPERPRIALEKTLGLWEGTRVTLVAVAEQLGVGAARAQQLRESAFAHLCRDLCVGSPELERALRSVFLRLLHGKQGMARATDWDEPRSSFYSDQTRACLAFAIVCRACRVKPDRLVTIGLDGVCYDSVTTKFNREQAIDGAKAVLLDVGRPMRLEDLHRRISREHKLDIPAEFLRRSIELSREVGIERAGAVGLRQWDYFDAHTFPQMARASLAAIGRAATSAEIARKAEELYPWRAPITPRRMCHAMVSHKTEFVSVRRVLFALSEWEVRRPPILKEVVAASVKARGGRASINEICLAAEAEGYKASSTKQLLQSHPELFRRASRGIWELASSTRYES